MPCGDGTGPWWGQGNWNCRRGFGRGFRGMGGGYNRDFGPAGNELDGLKTYANSLTKELEEVKKRIADMEQK